MDSETRRSRLQGCYVTIPTMFRDPDLEVDLDAIRRHVRFLIDGGLTTGNAVLLAGGAAGDFSTLTLRRAGPRRRGRRRRGRRAGPHRDGRPDDEHPRDRSSSPRPPSGSAPTTCRSRRRSTSSTPRAISRSTSWPPPAPPMSGSSSTTRSGRASASRARWSSGWPTDPQRRQPQVVGARTPGRWPSSRSSAASRDRFAIIDNQMRYVTSHILGARSIEVHVANYWPQWGVAPVADARARRVRRGAARDGTGRHAVHGPVVRDGGVHQRRRLPGQAVHGAGRARLRAAHGRRPATCGRCSARRRARCSWTAVSPVSWG